MTDETQLGSDESFGKIPMASKTPPSMYVVMRSNSATPERFQAADDKEALERLQKEVRAGQTPIVYCYKLWCAEEFVPSSVTTTVEDLKSRLGIPI